MYERFTRWIQGSKPGYVLWRTLNRYSEDNVGVRAGMLAYFLFFSLFPLLLLLISVASYVIPSDQAQETIFRLLSDFPASVRDLVVSNVLSAYAARGSATLVSLAVLAYSASRVYFAMSYALNAIWDAKDDRPWYRLYLDAFSVVGASLVLVAAILVLDTVTRTFDRLLTRWVPGEWLSVALGFGAFVLSLLASFALFAAIYRWVPNRRIGWAYIWPGAFVAMLLWKVSRDVFAWYLSTLSGNEAVYGSIGVIITLMLWLYFSATILLIGAEVNRSLADWQSDGAGSAQPEPEGGAAPADPGAEPPKHGAA